MNLDQFRATRRFCENLMAEAPCATDAPGWLYAGGGEIIANKGGIPNLDESSLTLGNEEFTGRLKELEIRLFEWLKDNGAFGEVKTPGSTTLAELDIVIVEWNWPNSEHTNKTIVYNNTISEDSVMSFLPLHAEVSCIHR